MLASGGSPSLSKYYTDDGLTPEGRRQAQKTIVKRDDAKRNQLDGKGRAMVAVRHHSPPACDEPNRVAARRPPSLAATRKTLRSVDSTAYSRARRLNSRKKWALVLGVAAPWRFAAKRANGQVTLKQARARNQAWPARERCAAGTG